MDWPGNPFVGLLALFGMGKPRPGPAFVRGWPRDGSTTTTPVLVAKYKYTPMVRHSSKVLLACSLFPLDDEQEGENVRRMF